MRKKLQLILMQSVLWLIISICYFSAKGQGYGSLPNIMAPEVATLGKFGAYPVSYYTGSPNISVPLYNLKESDINLDLSLQYDASGFIPNKESGTVGLNWSLMAGGVITRVVNWAPDDRNSSNINGITLKTEKGYIYGMLKANLGTYDKEYIRKLSFLSIDNQGMPSTALKYEYSPDIFSFNFNGHSGRFFLGNDGKVKVSGNQNYKVDLTSFSGQKDDLCDCQPSIIAITSEGGDVYTFGGDINTLEITYPYADNDSRMISCDGGVINAWHLKSIKTKNGKVVTFNYEPQSKVLLLDAETHHGVAASIDYAYEKIYLNEKIGTYFNFVGQAPVNTVGQKYRSLIKTAYLSSITTPSSTINFEYVKKTKSIYPNTEIVRNPNLTKQLENILIKNAAGKTIKQIDLTYTDYGSDINGYRQFLSKIIDVNLTDIANSSTYQFDYYKTDNLPKTLTKGIDIWGFYNGKDGNSSLVPAVSSGAPDFNIDLTNRKADPLYCDVALLKTITFPTGGSTEFKYEAHDYSKVLRKKVQSGMIPQWINETGYVGGARIKEINESSGIKRVFKYVKNYTSNIANPISSGISTDHNVFYLHFERFYNNTFPNAKDILVQDNNIAPSASYGESPIGYSEVTEIYNEGYTKYYYSTHETKPDKYTLGDDSYKLTPAIDGSLSNFLQQIKRLIKYSSCDIERGKELSTEVYNKNDQPLKKIVNKYNEDPARYNESAIGFNFPFGPGYALYHSYALYNFQNNIKQQQVFDYGLNNTPTLTQTINYGYKSNANPALIQKDEINSKGETFTSKFKYPTDYAVITPYNTMMEQNFIAPIVEQTELKNGAILNTTTNTFKKLDNNIIVPDSIKTKKNGFTENTEMIFNNYDNLGNLLQYTAKNKSAISMIWDYTSTYPIAECTNATKYDIAATSFETDGKGNFDFVGIPIVDATAPTGTKVYPLSLQNAISTGISSKMKTFIVTYWSKNGPQNVSFTDAVAGQTVNGWTFYKHQVINPFDPIMIQGNGLIDELRIYLKGSQMTTYTYEPLVGITSKCDADNNITYYEYDGLNRLKYIRDDKKTIIKTFDYKYLSTNN